MKKDFRAELRAYMTECLVNARKTEHMTQAEFSQMLKMDTRSYAALEHGENLCSTLTFMIYLCYFCKDVDELIFDLRMIIDKADVKARPYS